MKANELMIEDWVISNKRGKDEIVKVVSIEGGTNFCWLDADCFSGLVACEDLSPIPLTPEILEKNGWKETAYWHEYQDGKNIIQCCLPDMRGRINGIKIEHFKCEYVHQLQHALRLCGLNELADNFKI